MRLGGGEDVHQGWRLHPGRGHLRRAARPQTNDPQGRVVRTCLQAVTYAQETDIASDCESVSAGHSPSRSWLTPCSNGDIWQMIGSRIGQGYHPQVRKVKAHSTEEDVRIGLVSLEDFDGNAVADKLAGEGAACGAVPEGDVPPTSAWLTVRPGKFSSAS